LQTGLDGTCSRGEYVTGFKGNVEELFGSQNYCFVSEQEGFTSMSQVRDRYDSAFFLPFLG
jgi:hypothetical protein